MGLGSKGFMNPLKLYAKVWFCIHERILEKKIPEPILWLLESLNSPSPNDKNVVTRSLWEYV